MDQEETVAIRLAVGMESYETEETEEKKLSVAIRLAVGMESYNILF